MKKIYLYLLSAIASLAFVPAVTAQTITEVIGEELTFKSSGYTIKNNVGISKQVSSPMTDGSGRYWIKLEAFATGEASVITNSKPSDILLVLDVSTSMTKNKYGDITRLAALKNAVTAFIDNIYDNAVSARNTDPDYAGNRVGIVSFGGQATDVTEEWKDVETNHSSLKSLVTALNTGNSGTWTSSGLRVAIDNYLDGTPNSKRTDANLTVVVFTDGEPATGSGEGTSLTIDGKTITSTGQNFSSYVANNAVYYAHQLKQTYGAKVFSVALLGSNPDNRVEPFVELLSSNYPNSNTTFQSTATWTYNSSTGLVSATDLSYGDKNTDGVAYYQKVGSSDLTTIFEAIASQSGGAANTELTAASTTTVDVVSASFLLPTNAQSSDIKVFTAKCTGADPYTFATEVQAGHDNTTDVDNNIGVELGKDANNNDKISVTGFDYSQNWCGPIKNASGEITGYQGYKIIIMIPIIANPDAVGGPNVVTNTPESGIYVDGQTTPLIPFEYPTVSLPVNIYIKKAGLKNGESAKFIIEKAVLPDSGDPAEVADNAWSYVTSVFVTKPQLDETANNPVVKIKGLPASELVGEVQKGLVYRIREEGWSWSYTYSTDPKYTVSGQVNNPFVFTNTPKENIDIRVRHAESKATNVFKTGGGFTYDDSKTNVRP